MLMDLWKKESCPAVQAGFLRGAFAYPTWRAGALYLQVIEGDYPLNIRNLALGLATQKDVPGLGEVSLRMLAARQCPDLVEGLFAALVDHWRYGIIPEETIDRWYATEDETIARILAQVNEEVEKMAEEEEDEDEE